MIAGGRSTRFGSDKAVALLDGRPLINHAIAVLAPHVDAVVICGREWRGMTSLADPAPDLGPLGGIAAALIHAEAEGFDSVLTIACDMPEVPKAVMTALLETLPGYCTDAPILGHWPAGMAGALLGYLSVSPISSPSPQGKLGSRAAQAEQEPHEIPAFAGMTRGGVTKEGGKQRHLSIRRWAASIGATPVPAPDLRNINTPADLA